MHWKFAFILWLCFVGIDGVWINPIPFLIGSLFPDCDIKSSMVGKFFPMWLFFNHRGFTHTIPAAIVFSLPIGIFYDWKWAGLFMAGYMLHLGMDDSTPMRVKWWTGHKRKRAYH